LQPRIEQASMASSAVEKDSSTIQDNVPRRPNRQTNARFALTRPVLHADPQPCSGR
jgi:hypothetical protein